MPNTRNEHADRAFFEANYSRQRTGAAGQVERVALGHEVGLNGYTTVPEAQVLSDQLVLLPGNFLLDVGAGRGWPGPYVAQVHGARLISTDIPLDALRKAKADSAGVIAADGLFLLADRTSGGATFVPGADQIANFDFQNGPDSVELRDGGVVLDAIGYGSFGGGDIFAGEGNAAPDTPAGSSLARAYADVDTDDNLADFEVLSVPTPGVAEFAPVPEPDSGLLLLSGLSTVVVLRRRLVAMRREQGRTLPS
jgi:hypothetical protein